MSSIMLASESYKDFLGEHKTFSITGMKLAPRLLEFYNILNEYDTIYLYGGFEVEGTFNYNNITMADKYVKVNCLNLFLTPDIPYLIADEYVSDFYDRTYCIEERPSFEAATIRHNRTDQWLIDHINSLTLIEEPLDDTNFQQVVGEKLKDIEVLYIE